MNYSFLFYGIIFYLQNAFSYNDNSEEFTPFYDTIIYGDVAEILREINNNAYSPLLEALINNDANSDEKYEELLAEYQHYLDKAHKQKINYYEKNKAKNQVTNLLNERFPKTKATLSSFDNYKYSTSFDNPYKLQQTYNNPQDVFVSIDPIQTMHFNEQPKNYFYDKLIFDLPHVSINPYKQNIGDNNNEVDKNLNVRVTVEIGAPKPQPVNKLSHDLKAGPAEFLTLPLPYFNFPMPMNLFTYDKKNTKYHNKKYEHNLSFHGKNKSRRNNQKHKNKILTVPSVKEESRYLSIKIHPNLAVANNTEKTYSNLNSSTNTSMPSNKTIVYMTKNTVLDASVNALENKSREVKKIENSVESEYTKMDPYSADPAAAKTLTLNLRKKREIMTKIKTPELLSSKITVLTPQKLSTIPSAPAQNIHKLIRSTPVATIKTSAEDKLKVLPLKNNRNKSKKSLPSDLELTFWPNNIRNKYFNELNNITKLIVDIENKKLKLNMTKDIKFTNYNHTQLLEKVIFGEENRWNDVGTVAPVFMSFVGKYAKGALTFCSQTSCQSIKCADKTCIHRVCTPNERWNRRGHCTGSNSTDSIASLESIMDLPSNIAFEVVDILQEKMLGKMYGKMTLCINTKCISFIATEKFFLKSKCVLRNLNSQGLCPKLKAITLL